MVNCTTINAILHRNSLVETKLLESQVRADDQGESQADFYDQGLAHVAINEFLKLSAAQLQDFIHARMFTGKTFKKVKLAGADGKLNKTRHKSQTAESIASDCSKEEPCLVWYAWELRSADVVLEGQELPQMDSCFDTPMFSVVYALPTTAKTPSEYLKDDLWTNAFKSTVKGVGTVEITAEMMDNADRLAPALMSRLNLHIDDRVDSSKQGHFTLRFTRDNLAPMAAAMCLAGHVVGSVERCRLDERLLALPMYANYGMMVGSLAEMEGCYLYFDPCKYKWIRSGKTSGNGQDACFRGRGKKHMENARSKDEMRVHRLYREYPALGVLNLGAIEGNFDSLVMHCGMAYDKKESVTSLVSQGEGESLFIWSKETINELKGKGGELKKLQLDAVAYLWEICYDLLLAKAENVSTSPGFESLGLRVNRKRKRDDQQVQNLC